jgi:uracil-DNA glycosylase family 4
MPFEELVQVRTVKRKSLKTDPRGCEVCPLNEIKGIQKIMGTVEGKSILIVGQSPGQNENREGQEFIGDAGEFLWNELDLVGIHREDCDIFNVVRCLPADQIAGTYSSRLVMRSPTPVEIHCCSIHTEEALTKTKARHILILGQIAQKAFLKTRSVPAQKIFWSEEHQAKIYLADHPAFFVRGYGAGARIEAFRETMKQLAADWQSADDDTASDNYRYLREQKYHLILTEERAWNVGRFLLAYARKGIRVSADIEYDIIDGKKLIFAVGFSPKPGLSFIFVFDHPKIAQAPRDSKKCREMAWALLKAENVKKVMHFGCSDVNALREAGVETKGYDWDTNYSEYLYYPDEHNKYGLANIAERRFQQFSGYKSIIFDDLFDAAPPGVEPPANIRNGSYDAKETWLKQHDLFHLTNLRPDTLRLYTGGDADLTKRIEIDNKKKVPHALVKLYMDLGFLLLAMEDNGPWFDEWQHRQVHRLWPHLAAEALEKVRKMIGDPDFNPGSSKQVYDAIYRRLHLQYPLHKGKPNTRKQTMMMLSREHPFPGAVLAWRKASKVVSTYIDGPYEVAKRFGGRVRTTWWATGTAAGRLSSSGGDEGGMNLQNLHKDKRLQNLYVSDKRWRRVFNAIKSILKTEPRVMWEQLIEQWVRENMPDLKTFLILDYGQIEVRVAAQVSGDENLIADCASADIHSTVGSRMTGWSVVKIKHDNKTRTLTKNVHFGIMFGIDRRNLFEFIKAMDPDFNGTEEEVFAQFDRYFERYTGIARYIESQRELAQDQGYVETIFGLHRALNLTSFRKDFDDEDGDSDDYIDAAGERQTSWRNQCINTPVQGSAHQLLECGMVNMVRKPQEYTVLGTPSMDVHDALYFIVNVLELQEAYRKARYLMEVDSLATVKSDFPEIDWKVPIVVEAEAGLRLGTRVELKDDQFTVGGYLLDWYNVTKKQILDMKKQLDELPGAA